MRLWKLHYLMLALAVGTIGGAALWFGPAVAQEKAKEKEKPVAPTPPISVPSDPTSPGSASSGRYQFITAGTEYLLVDVKDGRVFRREKTGGGPFVPGREPAPLKVTWVEEDTSAVRAAPDPKK